MKILYIGVHSHKGWGAEYWLEKAFSKKNITCIKYNYRVRRKKILFPFLLNYELKKIIKKENPDLIFLQRGERLSPSIFNNIKTPIVFWSTEPIQLKNDVDKLLDSNRFNWVFVHTYSCLERINSEFSHHIPHCSVMHNACPSEIINSTNEKSIFAIFNRNISPRRDKWLSPSKDLITIESGKFGDDYFNDLAKANIAINIHFSDQNLDDFESGIFEAMAKGCAVISEKLSTKTVDDLGMRDAYIEVNTPEELATKLNELKNNSSIIKKYQEKSKSVILNNSWDKRADIFIEKFREIVNE